MWEKQLPRGQALLRPRRCCSVVQDTSWRLSLAGAHDLNDDDHVHDEDDDGVDDDDEEAEEEEEEDNCVADCIRFERKFCS